MPAGDPWNPELSNFAHVSCPGESDLKRWSECSRRQLGKRAVPWGSLAVTLNLTCIQSLLLKLTQ